MSLSSFSTHINKYTEHRLFRYLCFVLTAVFTIIYCKFRADDYDIWFHLAYGKHYWTHLTWTIDHTVYSWTPTIPDWKYVTWIGSVLLYLAYTLGDFPALALIQVIVFFGIATLFFSYQKRLTEPSDLISCTLLILVAVPLSLVSVYIKPEIFSTLLFAVCVFLFFTITTSDDYRLYLFYPVLFLLWVNTHGGFIFGLFFLLFAVLCEAMQYLMKRRNASSLNKLKLAALSAILSITVLFINPHGVNYLSELVRDLFFSAYMDYAPRIFAYTRMWAFIFPDTFSFKYIYPAEAMIIMAVIFLSVSFAAYRTSRFLNVTVFILNFVFFFISMAYARALIFFPILWLFSIPYIFHHAKLASFRKRLLPIALVIFLGFGGSYAYHCVVYFEGKSWFGSHIEEWIPLEETAYIKENKIPGPLFNDYVIGGYMLWSLYPDYKVFIDPRYGPYAAEVRRDWFNLGEYMSKEGLKAYTAKYPFKAALVHLREPSIIDWMLSTTEWKLVFVGRVAVVLVHQSVLAENNFKINPENLSVERFKDETNPMNLIRLFSFYMKHFGADDAEKILHYFKANIPDYIEPKEFNSQIMEMTLSLNKKKK